MSEVRRVPKRVDMPMMLTTEVRSTDELVEKAASAALSYSAPEPARPVVSWRSAALRVLFPRDDREQEIRFRRYLIAAATSLIVLALLGVCFLAGVLNTNGFTATSDFVQVQKAHGSWFLGGSQPGTLRLAVA